MSGAAILLIDDDEDFTATLARGLRRQHFEVKTAADGASALAALTEWTPAGVLIDLRLGNENGLQLLQQLRARLPQARLIMLTGFGSIATAVDAIKRGADDYLVKPCSLADLVVALQPMPAAADSGEPDEPAMLASEPLNLRQLSWEYIQRVLAEHDGNISAAARALGMHRRTLQRKLAKVPRPR
ncbi:response regulator [Permianibacter sp. IMCC34836]|uniref:response regulator transcription factor n=1 Tax=Permianibacter fluminis TaxID=2738515 RepID=UPI001551FE8B|nr:response regulator [Permianibacter fluminis]NQD36428.1 response regulator [Permianibacter fluminis]